ncbi:hypothetical protein [Cerasicoccus fimbriatus]|uniref:hypothetical protein n=1 Tax=Cerasicoccus fimbriatus TaxID=3014554 RepID=UPI0022B5603F|nr:hypothetical protein [Cerasicoccus sp. TK19100]
MPARELQTSGVVLAATVSGERFLRLHALSAEDGRLVIMWRRSSKTTGGPDIFDRATFHLESSSTTGAWFLKEYSLEHRHTGIARRYRSLQLATRLGELIWRNLQHTEFFAPTTQLAVDALSAFEDSPLPHCVYLKSLYRYAADEGYAVRQQWLRNLTKSEQDRAKEIIGNPLAELEPCREEVAAQLIEKMERWLRADTDIIVP